MLQLSGLHRPSPGTIGVIQEDALAGILLVHGNSLKYMSIFTKPDKNGALIMTDGKIYKNAVH